MNFEKRRNYFLKGEHTGRAAKKPIRLRGILGFLSIFAGS